MICNSFKIGEMAVATSAAEEYGFIENK